VKIREILCPVDFSDESREALHFGVELARLFGARLTLFNVYQMPGYALPEGVVLAGPEVLNELVDSIESDLRAWSDEARGLGAGEVAWETALGTPANEIERFARDHAIDLIVIGTHGRTGLRHVLLGSVAEKVVRHAPCPVLTVRPRDHALHAAAPASAPPPVP
jgi:nucleotide-binding universal stress UspA family protein